MAIDLSVLIISMRTLAQQAPTGPWQMALSSGYDNPTVRTPSGPLFSTGNSHRSLTERRAACAFVAAVNPAAILVLCQAVEQLQAERDALIAELDRLAELFDVEDVGDGHETTF